MYLGCITPNGGTVIVRLAQMGEELLALFFVLALICATLWMAVFADMGASLLVTANGLRLPRSRRP